MAIGSAAGKAKKSAQPQKNERAETKSGSAGPLKGHEERAATLRIYVKDKAMLKEAKLAALEEDTSLSQLWEEWAIDWLKSRKK
ncbi:hypothetical protein WG915_11295 [Corynebacterium sp. H128]|uniref:hypothetical protein n=1 Tax=unclassified Corynebacterium TaxID=2624378 RepID=UPI00309D2CE5